MRKLLQRIDWPTSVVGSLMLIGLVAIQLWNPPIVAGLRLKIFDQLQLMQPRPPQEVVPITIVAIDDASLHALGQWPWPRDLFALLIDQLGQMGAVSIVFDVIFAEEDRYSPPNLAARMRERAPDVAERLRGLPDTDEIMARAMADQRVVLGLPGLGEAEIAAPMPDLPVTVAMLGADPDRYIAKFATSSGLQPDLAQAASGIGLVTMTPDIDGIVRRVPLVAEVAGEIVPSLSLEALRTLTGERTLVVRGGEHGLDGIVMRGVMVPTGPDGRIWVRYGQPDPASYVSAHDILGGKADPQSINGRVIFVGATAAGLGDVKTVPGGYHFAGVEIQKQLLETMVSGVNLQRPVALINGERLFLLAFGLLLAWTGPFLRASYIPPVLALVAVTAAGVTWWAFTSRNLLVDGGYIAFALGMLLFWLAMAKYIREETQRRRIRNAFSRYLSPVMVDRLTRSQQALKLGGEKRDMTIMFTDIRGFTSISETFNNDPEGLTQLLNRYFTAMTEAIQASGGTIDKYIGDAIMAFWNAPLEDEHHARNACLAALAMRARLHEVNDELVAASQAGGTPAPPTIRCGIGLNTGMCFVGNLGSDQRFNYSVIGDPVNVASRVEGQTKGYGCDILIGEDVFARAPGLACLEADRVQLVGKSEPLGLYALLGDETVARSETFHELHDLHEQMLAAYRDRAWDLCQRRARQCQKRALSFGISKLYDVYMQRVEAYRVNPPPSDWLGYEVATSKA